jgi:hypothetical protein
VLVTTHVTASASSQPIDGSILAPAEAKGGLGGINYIEAREIAAGMRELLAQGIDPLDARRSDRRALPVFLLMRLKDTRSELDEAG